MYTPIVKTQPISIVCRSWEGHHALEICSHCFRVVFFFYARFLCWSKVQRLPEKTQEGKWPFWRHQLSIWPGDIRIDRSFPNSTAVTSIANFPTFRANTLARPISRLPTPTSNPILKAKKKALCFKMSCAVSTNFRSEFNFPQPGVCFYYRGCCPSNEHGCDNKNEPRSFAAEVTCQYELTQKESFQDVRRVASIDLPKSFHCKNFLVQPQSHIWTGGVESTRWFCF